MPIRVMSHQPSLFPYAGYWHRWAESHMVCFTTDVKFAYANYQNRVLLNGSYLTVPVSKETKEKLIKDVRIADGFSPMDIVNTIRGRCPKKEYPHLLDRMGPVFSFLSRSKTPWLADILIRTTQIMAEDVLDLYRSTVVPHPCRYFEETKQGRLLERLSRFSKPSVYLAGQGTASYLKDRRPGGWEVKVQERVAEREDWKESVLHYIGKFDDPVAEMVNQYRFKDFVPCT